MKITKIATQGRQDYSYWVSKFLVTSSLDGVHWQKYRVKSNDVVCTKKKTDKLNKRID